MSVWSYCKGTLKFPKKATIGIKESIDNSLINEEFNRSVELEESYESPNYRKFTVNISLCSEGLEAARLIEDLLKDLKSLGALDVDFDAEIRFLL